MQRPGQFRRGGTVHRGVVSLGDDREAAFRNALDVIEAFDNVHLPWRAGEIHRPGVNTRQQNTELPPVPRLGQGEVAYMEIDIEQVVLNPIRIPKPEGHLHDLASLYGRWV